MALHRAVGKLLKLVFYIVAFVRSAVLSAIINFRFCSLLLLGFPNSFYVFLGITRISRSRRPRLDGGCINLLFACYRIVWLNTRDIPVGDNH